MAVERIDVFAGGRALRMGDGLQRRCAARVVEGVAAQGADAPVQLLAAQGGEARLHGDFARQQAP